MGNSETLILEKALFLECVNSDLKHTTEAVFYLWHNFPVLQRSFTDSNARKDHCDDLV